MTKNAITFYYNLNDIINCFLIIFDQVFESIIDDIGEKINLQS